MTTVVRTLNYDGDVTSCVGQIMGPNTMGEFLEAIAATYETATDRTVVTLAYARLTPDVMARVRGQRGS